MKSMTRRERPRRFAVWVAAMLAIALCVPAMYTKSYAAVPKLDQIRVALFVSDGKNYNVTVPTVTLSSPKGLDIGIRDLSAVRVWTAATAGAQARFSADGYKVLLLETSEAAVAKQLLQTLNATQDKPYVFQTAKLGKIVYQVYAGMYVSKDEAGAAKQRIAANAAAAALLKGAPATIAGPLHWSAGAFPTEAAAGQQADAFRQLGLDAWVALLEAGGTPSYQVWIGEAADMEQLNAVQPQAVKLAPGIVLQPVDPAAPYLLKRDDVTASIATGGTAAATHYAFNPASQQVWITPKESGIAVAEKSNRQYRGSIEVSRHNGKLAVINELPFEQYLVSVVGAEMSPSWPAEALKAQAVAARSFALSRGTKYQIANVSDSSSDQVYYGIQREDERVAAAVSATAGEVLTVGGSPIEPYFFSNGGGKTGDPVEVWGQAIPYVQSTASPDEGAQSNKQQWHRVALSSGSIGYIREDFVTEGTARNSAGLPVVTVKGTGINIRSAPYVDDVKNGSIAAVNQGDKLVSLGKTAESNDYAWVRGPYTAGELLKDLNLTIAKPVAGVLERLEVSKRGPSGRAVELKANGQPITVQKPDQYRNALFDAPSTRFEIEETGRYTVLGANGQTRSLPETKGTLYASSAASAVAVPVAGPNMIVMGEAGAIRVATKDPQFRLTGNGSGHGLGMSQWGARGLAEQGYDYKRILQYYYIGITIAKD
jgi:stage II sporulation protein D